MEGELKRLLRYDRQRRMAEAFAREDPASEDLAVVQGGMAAVARSLDAAR